MPKTHAKQRIEGIGLMTAPERGENCETHHDWCDRHWYGFNTPCNCGCGGRIRACPVGAPNPSPSSREHHGWRREDASGRPRLGNLFIVEVDGTRLTTCYNGDCGACDYCDLKQSPAPERVFARMQIDGQEKVYKTDARPLGRVFPNLSPPSSFIVFGGTWILSSSKSWDYGSRMGQSFQEVSNIQ